jgi:hypothetical protein
MPHVPLVPHVNTEQQGGGASCEYNFLLCHLRPCRRCLRIDLDSEQLGPSGGWQLQLPTEPLGPSCVKYLLPPLEKLGPFPAPTCALDTEQLGLVRTYIQYPNCLG